MYHKIYSRKRDRTSFVFSFFFDFLILLPFFIKNKKQLRSKKLGFYFWRSFLVAISIYCSTYGVQHLALADTVILQYTFPLFTPVVLLLAYKRRVSMRTNCALLVGFIAIFFLVKPQWDLMHLASFAPLCAALAAAILAITLHELAKTEHVVAILFHCTWIPGCFSLIPFLYFGKWVPFSVIVWYCIPSSILGVIYQYLTAKAYSFTAPQIVVGFSYFCVLFSIFFGWVMWGETLDMVKIVGGILIVICGILLVIENSRKASSEKGLSTNEVK